MKYLKKPRLFDFQLSGWVTAIPYETALKLINQTFYAKVVEGLRKQGLAIKNIVSFMRGDLPEALQEEIYLFERETDSQPLKTQTERQAYFDLKYEQQIEFAKQLYIQSFTKRLIYFVFNMLPDHVQAFILENLASFGLGLETTIPLLYGKGTRKAYLDVFYGMLVKGEKVLLDVFGFLRDKYQGDPYISFFPAKNTKGEPIVMVQIGTANSEPQNIHLPDAAEYIWDIVDESKKANAATNGQQ